MINVQEHVYRDDPSVGPPDVRTELGGVDYFFLGNGLIQAAVQVAPRGPGTALGLLIMNPDRLRKKRESLTMDSRNGLAATLVRIVAGGRTHAPEPGRLRARWEKGPSFRRSPSIGRPARSGSGSDSPVRIEAKRPCCARSRSGTEAPGRSEGASSPESAAVAWSEDSTSGPEPKRHSPIRYTLDRSRDRVRAELVAIPESPLPAAPHWRSLANVSTGDARLDHFFRASRSQLPAAVSSRGVLDGSIWQYNREWCRDQSVIAHALVMLGDRAWPGRSWPGCSRSS